MRVSRAWRDFLREPHFWRSMMKKSGNYSMELNSMTDVIWPKLCYYTVCVPNLIKSSSEAGKLSFSSWKRSSTLWRRFKLSSRGARWDQGGGNHWLIEDDSIMNPLDYEDLCKENGGSTQNYVTSYDWCCREQVIRLGDVGLSNEIMDRTRPSIEVSEWFRARNDCGSVFCIRVELLDARRELVKFFEESETTEQWVGGEWRKVSHVFDEYDVGVRYLRFADAGKDTQFWGGHYGSKMAAAWARVRFN